MSKSKNQYVVPTKDGWGVRKEGSDKLTAKTETKTEAIKIGTEIAKNQHSELTILGKDGKIQNKNSFGNDPNPPKDKKHLAMIDISKQTVNINCPKCKTSLTVSLKQVANEVTINCNCGTEVQLVDSNGSAKKSIRDINGAFKDLENTIKSLGK